MTFDDCVYVCLLLLSLCLGPLMRRSRKSRSVLSSLFGFSMAFAATGLTIWHSTATVLGFIIFMAICPPKFLHYVAVLWCFGYLGFFRTCHHFGFAPNPPVANAVQLLITLRLIGVAFEIADSWRVDHQLSGMDNTASVAERERLTLVKELKNVDVSPLNLMCYAYCYIGLFTGPYYKYRTFQDFIDWPSLAPAIPTDQLLQQLQEAPFFGVSYLILSYFYTVDYVHTADFYERPFSYRFFYMMVIFLVFRLRIYFAWKVAECVCIAAGLGAYPRVSEPASGEGPTNLVALKSWLLKYKESGQAASESSHGQRASAAVTQQKPIRPQPTNTGPVVGKYSPCHSPAVTLTAQSDAGYDFMTINNISVWGCEFTPTVREGMRSWNRSVQYWLATNFNKRCPGGRLIRNVWTMLVSAYWHGIHPGYYLSFLTVPLALIAESTLAQMINTFGRSLPSGTLPFVSWVIKMRVFEYCAMGFLLLDAEATLAYWHSIGYCVHIFLISLIVVGFLVNRFVPPPIYSAYRNILANQAQHRVEETKALLRANRL
ncbi:Lysophospholipid acyltransferase 7 [Fasciola hepatica]|uniref:Lysophospholipid acyltransferase 7 n=1 Tax=Fasciola hepatica TaxID=6192 RepID=A0A4E0R496_FASHE|nr:Lysophospholipid acyltransferase 7 [Fasciola hepatica]